MASLQVAMPRTATMSGFDKFSAVVPRPKVSRNAQKNSAAAAVSIPALVTDVSYTGIDTWSTSIPIDDGESLQVEHESKLSLPVIDLEGLTCSCGDPAEAREKIVREIGNATEEWGFFQLINHGVPDALMKNLYDQTREFFGLPLDVKKRAEILGPDNIRLLGYKGTFMGGSANKIPIKESLADFWTESSSPTCTADLSAKIWPDGNPAFSNTVEEHCKATWALGQQLLELLAESLGLQRDYFSRHFKEGGNCVGTWRLHHFPANSAPSTIWRTVPHSDPSVLTILKQDVGGLQVKKPGENIWINVNPLPGSFVVNVGDVLEAWSNGRFPSVEHRVALNERCERFSTVNFLDAGPSQLIEAPPELVDDDHPSLYMPFIARDFRANFEKVKRLGNIRKGVALQYARRH